MNAGQLLTMVQNWKACEPMCRWLASLPPESTIVEVLAQLTLEHDLWLSWLDDNLHYRLPASARQAYERDRGAAREAYERDAAAAPDHAWTAYKAAIAPALEAALETLE
jgi:hypothetical protein